MWSVDDNNRCTWCNSSRHLTQVARSATRVDPINASGARHSMRVMIVRSCYHRVMHNMKDESALTDRDD